MRGQACRTARCAEWCAVVTGGQLSGTAMCVEWCAVCCGDGRASLRLAALPGVQGDCCVL